MLKINNYPQYTVEYISGVMSLRDPQKDSLYILEKILQNINPKKGSSDEKNLEIINKICPTFTNFEHTFTSLAFSLATGVGKTRLMGAFIAYLYTNYGIKNFFVVAPGTTVYNKLVNDLANSGDEKYVFKGLGCFKVPPRIYVEEDYKDTNINLFDSDIRIYVYNIDKFNKESANMKKINEILGDSFYKYLSELDDLTILMDESHHYRAEKGFAAINELNPLLGLELTATPIVTGKNNKQIPFENVVFEYPLSKAIADGYTRTPKAGTRSDINYYNFGEEQLDKLMISDGILWHEHIRTKLDVYSKNHNVKKVKPFVLIVCKDTDHAEWVKSYVCSKSFKNGYYSNKTITVHSKQKGIEKEENIKLLLDVEKSYNPIEIVIHVDKLKEGWDVNNLFTIIPLRTAASKILREQMVGRGLRLPYGERTNDDDIDTVMLTAHDKFADIIEEAQKGDSIFKAGNIIQINDLTTESSGGAQYRIEDFLDDDSKVEEYDTLAIERTGETDSIIKQAKKDISQKISDVIQTDVNHTVTNIVQKKVAEEVKQTLSVDEDLGKTYRKNENVFQFWIDSQVEKITIQIKNNYIPIPKIVITDEGVEQYVFTDFDLDITDFNHAPIKNEILIARLDSPNEVKRIKGDNIDFEGYNPEKTLLECLKNYPEIDYERSSDLIMKLITQVCGHYRQKYLQNGLQNIVMMYKKDISKCIYNQMMKHFYITRGFLQEEVVGSSNYNIMPHYTWEEEVGLYENYTKRIQSVLFSGIKKGVFQTAKFDSRPELLFARIIDRNDSVTKWLRPSSDEFNITYNRGHKYEPDFVVETEKLNYLVEVKRDDEQNKEDVLAKKERAIRYCEVASRWAEANNYKAWKHLFIPASQIMENSTFENLCQRYTIESQNIQ